ncbi:MAG: hypothetical protein HYY18_04550 [Planctomycetes bacterium]|nr:hypothetical protein [Planctomycetota bacterium]
MRAAPILAMALIPGLCDKPQDPSRGVPPGVWNLRQVMEREVTKDGEGREHLSPENIRKLREAEDALYRFEHVKDPDVAAEVLYLLPRFWHWEHRETLRNLLVFVNVGKAGPALEDEATESWMKPALAERKAVFKAIDTLHREIASLSPEARVARVIEVRTGAVLENPAFGERRRLLERYLEAALVQAGPAAAGPLRGLAQGGPHAEWAKAVLGRIPEPPK